MLFRSNYVARMDADDLAFPTRLQRQVEFLENNPAIDLLGARALVFHGDGTPLGLFPFRRTHADICRQPWRGFYLPHPTWMGRADWFKRNPYGVPEPRRAEDQDLLLRTYRTSRFACLPDVLLAYRAGRARLANLLAARMRVARSQLREHVRLRRPDLAILGAGTSLAKAGADLTLALAGRRPLTARAIDNALDGETLREWERLWSAANAWADSIRAAA